MHAVLASVAGEVARNRTSNCSRCDATPLAHLRHLSGTAWAASRPAGVHAQASSPPPQWRGLNVTMQLQRAQASREAALASPSRPLPEQTAALVTELHAVLAADETATRDRRRGTDNA